MSETYTADALAEYFDLIAEKLDAQPYHRHFKADSINSDGLKLHLDIFEHHPKAPNIIMIHGTALYSMCYSEIMYKLGIKGYNVIGVDLRGHGRSDGKRGDYTIMELMKDVDNTIEYVSERFNNKISLIGSSQGGIVAFYMAAKEAKVQSVICQNFAVLTDPSTLNLTRSPGLTAILKPLVLTMSSVLSERQIPISTYLDLEAIKVRYWGNAKKFMDSDPLALKSISVRSMRSLATTELSRAVEDINIPVMVFQGNKDSIFPVSYTREIFDRLQCKKRMEVYDGLNHALITEDVDVILPAIFDWLKDIYPEARHEEDSNP